RQRNSTLNLLSYSHALSTQRNFSFRFQSHFYHDAQSFVSYRRALSSRCRWIRTSRLLCKPSPRRFARVYHGYRFKSDNDDAIVYRHLTMNRVMVDLYAMMQELVNKEVTTTCNHDQCLESFAAGLSIMTSAKPFGVGMEVTTTVDYSYSQTSEESTTLKYDFDVVRSDPGYIVMVNAQARSELVRPDVIAAGLKM
ncbi:hypothetical protein BGZ59_002817, partial [Podila verticillata]